MDVPERFAKIRMNNNFSAEARERWGETAAYREHAAKTKSYTKEKLASATTEKDGIFAGFAECKTSDAQHDSEKAIALAAELQGYITENFYTCTKEILHGLGQMYVSDERFKKNIDKHGNGTAEFVSAAIVEYCKGE